MYSKTTKKINITVKPYYLEDQSEPEDQHYVWAYKVTIDNQGKEKVQLVNRHWKIMMLMAHYKKYTEKVLLENSLYLILVKNLNTQVELL